MGGGASSVEVSVGDRACPTFDCDYSWTLENFPSISDKVVKSPTFSGEADGVKVVWELQLYPNGVTEGKGYVALDLCLVSCNKAEIDIEFNLSIVNRHNVKCKTMKGMRSKFAAAGNVSGLESFVRRVELMDKTKGLLVNGDLKIHCIIHIGRLLKNNSLRSIKRRDVVIPKRSLPLDFWQLYVNRKLVDVTVEVKGKEFMVHKAVLAARSPVFACMFDTDMVESISNRIVISDIEPEVFVELLRFMYSDQAENLDKFACGLLACAEKYALEWLKVMCEESIRANLSVERAADVLLLADLQGATWLKRETLDFINVQPMKVTQTDGWKTLIVNHPHLVAEAFQSLADVRNE